MGLLASSKSTSNPLTEISDKTVNNVGYGGGVTADTFGDVRLNATGKASNVNANINVLKTDHGAIAAGQEIAIAALKSSDEAARLRGQEYLAALDFAGEAQDEALNFSRDSQDRSYGFAGDALDFAGGAADDAYDFSKAALGLVDGALGVGRDALQGAIQNTAAAGVQTAQRVVLIVALAGVAALVLPKIFGK